MGGLLPPVIATLIADTKQYTAKITDAEANMTKFGASSMTTAEKMTAFGKKATTAVASVGIAMVAYGVDKALKYTKALDNIQNQAGASASEIDYLKGVILTVSSQTAISSDQIANAFLQVEKAGIRGAAAYKLVDSSAKAAAITGGDVAAIATTIVAAQSLQITKGQSVAQITDTLVKANQNHIGSLDNLVGLLKGKVGGALAAYGINLGEAAAVADVASKAGYTNARSMTTLATGLGKVENPTKAQTKALAAFGINAEDLARKARTPGTGLIDTLKALEVQSQKTGIPLEKLVTATFGAGAVGLVSALAKQLPALATLNTSLQSSSAKGLDTAFGITSEQLNFKIAQIKTQLENAFTGIGITLLPSITDVANWVTTTTAYLQKHPLVQKIASDAVIAAFVAALGAKMIGLGVKIAAGFGLTLEAGGAAAIGAEIAAAVLTAISLKNFIVDPFSKFLITLKSYFSGGLGPGLTSSPSSPKTTTKPKTTSKPVNWQMSNNEWITAEQIKALAAFVKTDKNPKDYAAALKNFVAQDLKGNYSVTINLK